MKHFQERTGGFPWLLRARCFGGILAGATHYLTPQQHDYGSVWGMYEQEQTDSIDVLFFGSSVTYCDVVPAVYWKNSGLTAFVQAGPEQPLPLTLDYLKEVCARKSPACGFRGVHRYSVPQIHGLHQNQHRSDAAASPSYAIFFNAEPEVRKGLCSAVSLSRPLDDPQERGRAAVHRGYAGRLHLSVRRHGQGPDDCETVDINSRTGAQYGTLLSKTFTRSAAGTIFSWYCTVPRQSVCTMPTGTG